MQSLHFDRPTKFHECAHECGWIHRGVRQYQGPRNCVNTGVPYTQAQAEAYNEGPTYMCLCPCTVKVYLCMLCTDVLHTLIRR